MTKNIFFRLKVEILKKEVREGGWLKEIFETLFLGSDGKTESYNMKVKTSKDGNVTDIIYWKSDDSSGHGHIWGLDKDSRDIGGRSSKD